MPGLFHDHVPGAGVAVEAREEQLAHVRRRARLAAHHALVAAHAVLAEEAAAGRAAVPGSEGQACC